MLTNWLHASHNMPPAKSQQCMIDMVHKQWFRGPENAMYYPTHENSLLCFLYKLCLYSQATQKHKPPHYSAGYPPTLLSWFRLLVLVLCIWRLARFWCVWKSEHYQSVLISLAVYLWQPTHAASEIHDTLNWFLKWMWPFEIHNCFYAVVLPFGRLNYWTANSYPVHYRCTLMY